MIEKNYRVRKKWCDYDYEMKNDYILYYKSEKQ